MKNSMKLIMAVMIAMMPYANGRAACPIVDALVTDAAPSIADDGERCAAGYIAFGVNT